MGANSRICGTHESQKLSLNCSDSRRSAKETFPNAHCYAHQLNLVPQQAASQIPSFRIFFANLNGFTAFFNRSTERIACPDECAAKRIP